MELSPNMVKAMPVRSLTHVSGRNVNASLSMVSQYENVMKFECKLLYRLKFQQ